MASRERLLVSVLDGKGMTWREARARYIEKTGRALADLAAVAILCRLHGRGVVKRRYDRERSCVVYLRRDA